MRRVDLQQHIGACARRRLYGIIVALCLSASACATPNPRAEQQNGVAEPLNPQFEQLVARYLKDVKGIGGGLQADMSAVTFGQHVAAERAVLKDLQGIDRKSLAFVQQTDYRFLQAILESNIREEEKIQRWRQDPRLYVETNPITFKLQADPREPEERGVALVRDMQNQQAKIANAKLNLTEFMPRWLPYTNARIDGTILHFQTAVPEFAERLSPTLRAQLLGETDKAIEALRDFRIWVNNEWTKRPQGDFRIGAELFDYLQQHRHLFNGNDRTLRTIARGGPDFTKAVTNY
jgi:hypothetical protein